jgi:hypothetical protein
VARELEPDIDTSTKEAEAEKVERLEERLSLEEARRELSESEEESEESEESEERLAGKDGE